MFLTKMFNRLISGYIIFIFLFFVKIVSWPTSSPWIPSYLSISSVERINPIECGNEVNLTVQRNHWIATPDFPRNYPPDTDCSWQVKANFGDRIRLIFEEFSLQPGLYYKCKSDFLEIRDAGKKLRFCGLGLESRQHITSSSQVEIRFRSDSSWESTGFRIQLQAFSGRCTAIINDVQSGNIASPNYPLAYPPNTVCSWKITVPENMRIHLDCREPFQLEGIPGVCRLDYLAVSIVGDESFIKSRRYCWDEGPKNLASVENVMTILFHSNAWYQFRGFRCKFKYLQNITSYSFPTSILPKCNCSQTISQVSGRIVGGKESSFHAYPWIAAIVSVPGVLLCGGSLISDRYILTASHCFMRIREPRLLKVILGDHNLRLSDEEGVEEVGIERIITHPNYDQDSTLNDIALIRLSRSIQFSPVISPICLPTTVMDLTGRSATVAGWGKLSNVGPYSDTLQEVELIIQSPTECQRQYNGIITITSQMICAGNGTKDSCQGDSGGPLMMRQNGIIYQVGIVSFGLDCGTFGVPGVYTKVDQYLDFIAEHALRSDKCVPLKNNSLPPRILGNEYP